MTEPDVILPSGATACAALPEHANAPGVVVIHEIWGVERHIRSVVDRLADAGYAAIAPNLFGGLNTQLPEDVVFAGYDAIMTVPPEQRAVPERVAAALETLTPEHREEFGRLLAAAARGNAPEGHAIVDEAIAWLRGQGAPKVGLMGFCFGGRVTWAHAYAGGGADAYAPFYGALPPDPDPTKVRAPIEGHFGAEDQGIPIAPIEAAALALRWLGRDATIHVYPGAPHAFFNDRRPGAYRADAAALAWQRLMAFFARTLT